LCADIVRICLSGPRSIGRNKSKIVSDGSPVNSHTMTNVRPRLKRVTGVVAAAAVLVLASCTTTAEPGGGGSAGGGGTLDTIKENGSVKVAFAAEEPYGFLDGSELVGEAPALHGEIFNRIGEIELEGTQYDFNALIPALNSGDVDAVSAGMFITPERCEQASFSNPEYVAKTALMVKKGNPKGLTDFDSIAKNPDARVAVMTGAVEVDQAAAAGIKDGQMEKVQDQNTGVDAVTSGRADAFALTDISLNWSAKDRDDVEVTTSFVPVVDGEEQMGVGAAVFRKDDTALRDAFNEQLKAVVEDGDTWLKLVEPYGFTEENKPDPSMTAEQFCGEG
jgi:polar amino acid transport system substrate-binding protein